MNIAIVNIHNNGGIDEEHILLKAVEDCDIGYYAIVDMTYLEDGMISGKLKHFYWFPHKDIKKNDLVSLRTGHGKDRTIYRKSGIKIHRFYWNLDAPVWNDTGDTATLIHTPEWSSMIAK